tara:strand:+ start:143 stop:1987 length:1845 start_codon:yes stop_codon:yes gene_type:complete
MSSNPAPDPRSHPPLPTLALRVGVVGHRPERLVAGKSEELERTLGEVLAGIHAGLERFAESERGLFGPEPAMLRALSPLAEGADRVFAKQALALDYRLACVLPFPRAEYERDFTGDAAQESDSVQTFRDLLARCESVLELDGDRDGPEPYGACGSVVVENADVLVVVWDGRRERRPGGTEGAMDLALSLSIPVIWIPAEEPSRWGILRSMRDLPDGESSRPRESHGDEDLHGLMREALGVPGADPNQVPEEWTRYQAEDLPERSFAIAWRAFTGLITHGTWPSLSTRLAPMEWPAKNEDTATSPDAVHYAWANRLAMLYADRYRSTFVFSFLLAAFAVAMALLPHGTSMRDHGAGELTCVVLEIFSIVVILLVVLRGRKGCWHERWIDYRMLAESLRHLRLISPIEGTRPMPAHPEHHSEYGRPEATWVGWAVRSIERSLPLPNASLDASTVDAALAQLQGTLQDQRTFHKGASHRAHVMEHRLHLTGMVLLALTLTAGVLHLLGTPLGLSIATGHALTAICGIFPALGAALAGIAHQGEFRRVMKRSRAMEQVLGDLEARVRALREDGQGPATSGIQRSRRAAALAMSCSQVMLQEVLDWRVVFLDQPLRPPA